MLDHCLTSIVICGLSMVSNEMIKWNIVYDEKFDIPHDNLCNYLPFLLLYLRKIVALGLWRPVADKICVIILNILLTLKLIYVHKCEHNTLTKQVFITSHLYVLYIYDVYNVPFGRVFFLSIFLLCYLIFEMGCQKDAFCVCVFRWCDWSEFAETCCTRKLGKSVNIWYIYCVSRSNSIYDFFIFSRFYCARYILYIGSVCLIYTSKLTFVINTCKILFIINNT